MAVSLKHAFNNPKADGGDATIARPSDWNAEHSMQLSGTIPSVIGRTTAGTGVASEIPIDNLFDPSQAWLMG